MENSNNEHPSVEDVNNAISILKAAVDASNNRKIDSESLEIQSSDLVCIKDAIEALTKQVKELTKEIDTLKWYVTKNR